MRYLNSIIRDNNVENCDKLKLSVA